MFVAGLACIAVGFALAVLHGPLTLPPGFLRLSTGRGVRPCGALLGQLEGQAQGRVGARWAAPGSPAAVTLGGLALAVSPCGRFRHFELVDKPQAAIGM